MEPKKKLTTYYNGTCPVCRPEIERYGRSEIAGDAELGWCDINRDEAALAAFGVTADDVRKRLHAVDEQGRVMVGVTAFAAIWQELRGHRWLARLIRLPVVRQLAHWLYEGLVAVLWSYNKRRTAGAGARSN